MSTVPVLPLSNQWSSVQTGYAGDQAALSQILSDSFPGLFPKVHLLLSLPFEVVISVACLLPVPARSSAGVSVIHDALSCLETRAGVIHGVRPAAFNYRFLLFCTS